MDDLINKIIVPDDLVKIIEQSRSNITLSISYSGGKDSDCMCQLLPALVKHRGWQDKVNISVIHADLGGDWFYTAEYLDRRQDELGLPFTVVKGDKTIFDLFENRHNTRPDVTSFSSSQCRFCTSYKVSLIDKSLRHSVGKYGTVISAVGLRAAESRNRAAKAPWIIRDKLATQTRSAFTWLPIHNLSEQDVWASMNVSMDELTHARQIAQKLRAEKASIYRILAETNWLSHAGHLAYLLGNTRYSCACCTLASLNDLQNGIEYHVEFFRRLTALEIKSGFHFSLIVGWAACGLIY